MLETVVDDMETFFQEVTKELSNAADAFLEFSEDVVEQIQQAIAPQLDPFEDQLDEWLEPILEMVLTFENTFTQAAEPVTQTVEPVLNQQPVCMGCRHYHGQTYNGVMLVCAMHPYGVSEGVDTCPDKEPVMWLSRHWPSDSDHSSNDFF